MANSLIIERLRESTDDSEVAECIIQLFMYEVENAMLVRPQFRDFFNKCIKMTILYRSEH